MRKGPALWLLVITLVFTRVIGLHLHACASIESGVPHTDMHAADSGMLFGDYHAHDHDSSEIDLVSVASKTASFHIDDLVAGTPNGIVLPLVSRRVIALVSPRGPPVAIPELLPYFSPPLRGPPSNSQV